MLLVALGLVGSASAQMLPFTQYSPESEVRPLPSAEIHGVSLDRDGYLWIVAYSSGLVRYDGVRMELYNETDGLRDVALWEAAQDPEGRLWVASNGGLAVSERPLAAYGGRQRVTFATQWRGVPLLDIAIDRNQVAFDARGRVWVGTDGLGIVRYSHDRRGARADTLRLAAPGAEAPSIRTILARADGSIWAGLADGRIVEARRGRLPFRRVAELATGHAPSVLYESANGRIWVGTRGGDVWRIAGRDSLVAVASSLGSAVVSMVQTSDGKLAVATGADGLVILPLTPGSGPVRRVTRRNGLLGDVLHDLALDSEGNVWVAQSGGLSKLRSNYGAFLAYTADSQVGERPLLPSAAVGAVAPERVGGCDVWAGTSEGVGCVTAGIPASGDVLDTEDGLSSVHVNALVASGERLWIGTLRGVFSLSEPGISVAAGAQSVRSVRINGQGYRLASYGGSSVLGAETLDLPVEGRAEAVPSVWFASYRRLLGLVDDRWIQFDTSAGLPQTVVHAVAVDGEGRLWVGTRDQGLYRARRRLTEADLERWARPSAMSTETDSPETVSLFDRVWSTENGAPTDQIESLLRIGDEMWVATPAGLFALGLEDGRWGVVAALGEDEGLPSVRVFSLAQSPVTGSLWVGTNGGLTEVDPSTHQALRSLTRQDGLVGNEVWFYGSVRADDAGRIYFGTAQGLSVVDPALVTASATPPRLHLRGAEVVQRASGHTEASFQYAATSFADERAVRYRYRLVGYDEEWSEATPDPKVRYTNLPALGVRRRYTMEVIAGTVGGPWTPRPLRTTFYVTPPWWLGWGAFLGYAILFSAIVFAVDRVQRRRLVERERERTRLREAELGAEAARAEQAATEARAQALTAEAERQAVELSKARELAEAFHQLEEAHGVLVETQAQLVQQEKMASLGRVTAGVAHELKNPLNFVTNFAQLSAELTEELSALLATPGDDAVEEIPILLADLRRNADSIEAHGRRADEIVRHMLLHSHGAAGPREEVVLNDVVEDSISLAKHGKMAANPGAEVRVTVTLAPDRAWVSAAPRELGRVLINLFDNAFDAVRARQAAADADYVPSVDISTEVADGQARVRVADNGTGIPESVRDNIFEPFFTTKPAGQGTGLGLSLSFDIVHQHQGTLTALDQPSGGAVFVIALPVVPRHGAKAEPTNGVAHHEPA